MSTDSTVRQTGWRGPAVAAAVIGAWGTSLSALLTLGTGGVHPALWLPAILLQTFLHTGLFITAHDAMHGSVTRDHPRLNDAVGRLATLLYALFSYQKLRSKHADHHHTPVTGSDPDYHDADHERFWAWYLGFLREYVGVWQIVGMALVFNLLHHGLGVGLGALNLFWVLPSLLSTLQLFYFGTYLPHRHDDEAFVDEHRATSNDFSPLVSFLTCYHFGYHHEHHRHPGVPWWRLPAVRAGDSADPPQTVTSP